ncbi:MAG TPA: hypothetical protein VGD48_23670 [Kutzneria sp.]|jgi:hypothetical protein
MAQHVNKGIQMFGGTINADNIAVGDDAHAGDETGEAVETKNTVDGEVHTVVQSGRIDSVSIAGSAADQDPDQP